MVAASDGSEPMLFLNIQCHHKDTAVYHQNNLAVHHTIHHQKDIAVHHLRGANKQVYHQNNLRVQHAIHHQKEIAVHHQRGANQQFLQLLSPGWRYLQTGKKRNTTTTVLLAHQ